MTEAFLEQSWAGDFLTTFGFYRAPDGEATSDGSTFEGTIFSSWGLGDTEVAFNVATHVAVRLG
jgi:hypothetical protein